MENEVMIQVLTFATAIGAIVATFMQMVKKAAGAKLDARFVPIVALFVGMAIGAAAYPFTEMDLVLRLWAGGLAGWQATGMFETTKQTKKM